MELKVIAKSGGKASKVPVSEAIFAIDYNETLVHQVVEAFRAGARQGSVKQKNRADVRGGGAKPWRQKGTGRARAGTSSSPIWRSGGVTFAARPRDYGQKVNRKMYRKAVKVILSELVRQERLNVIKKIDIDAPKTKAFIQFMSDHKLEGKVLFVVDDVSENLYLSSRNIPHVAVIDVSKADVVSMIKYDHVIMTPEAVKNLEEKLS